MCYKDKKMILETIYSNIKSEPSIRVDLDGVEYKIWPVTDKNTIQNFVSGLSSKPWLLQMDTTDIRLL